jgi:hypothetical protein
LFTLSLSKGRIKFEREAHHLFFQKGRGDTHCSCASPRGVLSPCRDSAVLVDHVAELLRLEAGDFREVNTL